MGLAFVLSTTSHTNQGATVNVTATAARTFAAVAVIGATFLGGLSTGAGAADASGTHVALADDPAVSAGVCRAYDHITVCAPLVSPTGAPLVGKVEEDGSAGYADGQTFDAEDATFRPSSR